MRQAPREGVQKLREQQLTPDEERALPVNRQHIEHRLGELTHFIHGEE